MSKGQSPFDTNYSANSISLVNVKNEDTEDAEENITFIKGSAGNGKRLYVDGGNLTYNPFTQTLSANNHITDTITLTDYNIFPTNMKMECINGQVVITGIPSLFPYDAGIVSIGGLGTILISGGSNYFAIADRSTGDYFQQFSDAGTFTLKSNFTQNVFEISTAGLASLKGTGAGLRFFERLASPTNYYQFFTSSSGSVFTLTYNASTIATITTAGITTLVPQKIQNTISASASPHFLTFVPLSATTTAGQVISTNASLSYTPSTGTLTATTFSGSLSGSATLVDNTLQTTGIQFLTFLPLSATTSTGQVVGTDSALNYNVATETLISTNVSIATTVTIGGTNTITYNGGNTRTTFTGGSGILVGGGISLGTSYSSSGVVGISGIMNSLTSTNFIQIYDNAIAIILYQMNSIRTRTTLPFYIGNVDGYTASNVPLAMLQNTLADGFYNNIQLGHSSLLYKSWFIGARNNTTAINTIFSISPYGIAQNNHFYINGSGITSSPIFEGRTQLQLLDQADNTYKSTLRNDGGFLSFQENGVIQGGFYSSRTGGFFPLAGFYGFKIGSDIGGAQLILADVDTYKWATITGNSRYEILSDNFDPAGALSVWGTLYFMDRYGRNTFYTNNYRYIPLDTPVLSIDAIPFAYSPCVPNTLTDFVSKIVRTGGGNVYDITVKVSGDNPFGRVITISNQVALNFNQTAVLGVVFPTTTATQTWSVASQSATINGSPFLGYTFVTTGTGAYSYTQSAISSWNIFQPVGTITYSITPTNTGNEIDEYVFTIDFDRVQVNIVGMTRVAQTTLDNSFITLNGTGTARVQALVSGTGTLTTTATPANTLLTTTRNGLNKVRINPAVSVSADFLQTTQNSTDTTLYPIFGSSYLTTTYNDLSTDFTRSLTVDALNGEVNITNLNAITINNRLGNSFVAPAGTQTFLNCFSLNYKHYDIVITLTNATNAGTYLFIDLATSAGVRSGANWDTRTSYVNGAAMVSVVTPTASFYVALAPNTTISYYRFTLFSPYMPTRTGIQTANNCGYLTAVAETTFTTTGVHNVSTAYPSLFVGCGTGLAMIGTIYCNGFN